MTTIAIPDSSCVILIGVSGSGKSTFAREHFLPTEAVTSDFCRALVADSESDLTATKDAFEVLHLIAAKRLASGRLTVIDATNVQAEARRPLLALAHQYYCLPIAIVFNLPERLCQARNKSRPDRDFGAHVIRRQGADLRRSLHGLQREGFRRVFVLSSVEEVEGVTIERESLRSNREGDHGPFDIIGDVHGCCDELEALLGLLGYVNRGAAIGGPGQDGPRYAHPDGRKAIFLGDLVDRGPRVLDTIRLVKAMVDAGSALCVPGNHDARLVRKLRGRDVAVTYGLAETLAELEAIPEERRPEVSEPIVRFLDELPSHFVLNNKRLVVAHAGMTEPMQGRAAREVREFALYGETTGETDEYGLPLRYNWAADYRGKAAVVYGHTPVPKPEWLNGTINVDTGCVFGGRLTALRFPERELRSVPARRVYHQPVRPWLTEEPAAALSAQQVQDDVLDLDDVTGKRVVDTQLFGAVTVREENAVAALEVMSRFAVDPRWLVYLPPTMSPCETSKEPGLLEHPAEAFAYYRREGVQQVLCEEKHMGSRAVVVCCRDEDAARRRFGVTGQGSGIVYTRTGRRFFDDRALEDGVLARIRTAMEEADLWRELESDWVLLDAELMPWSAKAQQLLRQQFAAVGSAAGAALGPAVELLEAVSDRVSGAADLLARYQRRHIMASQYVDSYRRYCWSVHSVDDHRLAPFHLLASEKAVYMDKSHAWHLATLGRLCRAGSPLLLETAHQVVDVNDGASMAQGAAWWEALTGRGGEGMVVKPLNFVARGRRRLVQPAVKCRGREYLRLIYGPEYTATDNLDRLRERGLGAKRSLALREFALGAEGLDRFVRGEPLRRVHECAFGVLALESEPVDPRL